MGKEGGFQPNGHEAFSARPNRVTPEHQVIQRRWQEAVYDGQPDVVGRLRQFQQESREVIQEIEGESLDFINNLPKERAEALGGEVVDTIIAGLGLLDTLGMDFGVMFLKKVGIMYEKYNPAEVAQLLGQGMSHGEAMAHLKGKWNGNGHKNGT